MQLTDMGYMFLQIITKIRSPAHGKIADRLLIINERIPQEIPTFELTVVITDLKSIKEQSHLSLLYLLLIFFSFSDISHMMLLYVEAKLSFTSLIFSISSAYLYAALIAPRGFKQLK